MNTSLNSNANFENERAVLMFIFCCFGSDQTAGGAGQQAEGLLV